LDGARKNLGLKKPISDIRKDVARTALFNKETRFDKPRTFKNRFQERSNENIGFKKNIQLNRKFKPRTTSNKTYAEQMEGNDKSELDRRKAAGVRGSPLAEYM
jgi:hypothetical protein